MPQPKKGYREATTSAKTRPVAQRSTCVEGADTDTDETLACIARPSSPTINGRHRHRATRVTLAVASITKRVFEDLSSAKEWETRPLSKYQHNFSETWAIHAPVSSRASAQRRARGPERGRRLVVCSVVSLICKERLSLWDRRLRCNGEENYRYIVRDSMSHSYHATQLLLARLYGLYLQQLMVDLGKVVGA